MQRLLFQQKFIHTLSCRDLLHFPFVYIISYVSIYISFTHSIKNSNCFMLKSEDINISQIFDLWYFKYFVRAHMVLYSPLKGNQVGWMSRLPDSLNFEGYTNEWEEYRQLVFAPPMQTKISTLLKFYYDDVSLGWLLSRCGHVQNLINMITNNVINVRYLFSQIQFLCGADICSYLSFLLVVKWCKWFFLCQTYFPFA